MKILFVQLFYGMRGPLELIKYNKNYRIKKKRKIVMNVHVKLGRGRKYSVLIAAISSQSIILIRS